MRSRALRAPDADEVPVTNMELFFDLVYVFAITQLSEFLFDHLSLRGGLEALVLFSAVWWAWNYTAWATNWVDPARSLTALVLMVMMAIGLVMSAALPEAFESRGLPFAIAYVALHLLRTAYVAWAFPAGSRMRANNLSLLAWLAIAGALWITGGCLHGDAKLVVWLIAAAVDQTGPLAGFWLPGAGRTPVESWELTGSHLAERCQLVVIIALGESVLRVGETFAEQHGSVSVDASFVAGFVTSAALWAAYFLCRAQRGAQSVAGAERAARIGRSGYAYAHAAMVAGVIVVAVAIRLTIEHPGEASTVASTALALGGPVLYLAGLALFERFARIGGGAGTVTTVAILCLLVLAAVAGADHLTLAICVTVVLAAFAVGSSLRDRAGRPGAGPVT
jgi:low temperature requirement protein LtrA